MKHLFSGIAARRLLVAAGLVGMSAGCDSLLNVDNPATFSDADLDDPALANGLVAGVIGRLQSAIDDLAWNSAVITDEAVTGHNFETYQLVDLRKIDETNASAYGDVYNQLQVTRAAADSFGARLNRVLGDSASKSSRVATIDAYGALSYVLMGEFLCEAPVDPVSAAVSSDSLTKIGVSRAMRAITVATAAQNQDILNFARVTAARGLLNLNLRAEAAAMAALVPATFRKDAFYNDVNSNNVFFASISGANRNLGVDASFRNLNDPRVRHSATGGTGHDQRTVLFIPTQSPSFSGWTPTSSPAFTRSTAIRISSGIEAQYIMAEAQGLNAVNLAFINARRAVGGQTIALVQANLTEDQFQAEVRDQRRRDFFLDGHRLGDLRRYKKYRSLDLFQKGVRPTAGVPQGEYGTSECFVPSLTERIANPAY